MKIDFTSHRFWGLSFYLAILLVCVTLPAFSESDWVVSIMPTGLSGSALLHIGILIFLFAYLGCAWNILGGFAGQLSLGHAAFFGIGAYTSSLLYIHFNLSPWLGMVLGAGLAGIVGYGLGYVSFKYGLKGPFFALVTIAFSEILRLLTLYWDFTGGPLGLLIPLTEDSFWGIQFTGKVPYYYIALGLMLFGIFVTALISSSRFGYYLRAIRESEEAAEALGIHSMHNKMHAVALSAALTALGGSFYAQYTQYIVPDDVIKIALSIEIILFSIVGGNGLVMGPVVGAFILTPIGELTRVVFVGGGSGSSLIALISQDIPSLDKFFKYLEYLGNGGGGGLAILFYGSLLVFVCLVMPRGILPAIRKRLAHSKSVPK